MIVVAGHLCLDVIPEMTGDTPLQPGALLEVGPVSFSAGGAVANVGLALSRLGLEPALLGLVGNDPLGRILREVLGQEALKAGTEKGGAGALGREADREATPDGPGLGQGQPDEAASRLLAGVRPTRVGATSYSLVIDPPRVDRSFLHHPGCNDTFKAQDIEPERWSEARLLHFGYPPLMQSIFADGGEGLAAAFARLRESGVTVSLDMAMPDPGSSSGRVDWPSFLRTVLPHVDLFLPSWDEIRFMLEPSRPRSRPTPDSLSDTARHLLSMGPALVALKLGDAGLYLRTADPARLEAAGRSAPGPAWSEREILSSNYKVEARGTTGAGDATIAGLLAAIVQGLDPLEAAATASAVGASSVEGVGAVAGIGSWQETRRRMSAGWEREVPKDLVGGGVNGGSLSGSKGWRHHEATGALLGPNDTGGGL